ncbi:MAG: hypothetical protein FWD67_07595 [Betaproteobacteria bacterium]|nr:hypothetical protein [Betaproteobacteria bacterium]
MSECPLHAKQAKALEILICAVVSGALASGAAPDSAVRHRIKKVFGSAPLHAGRHMLYCDVV